jgi:hypothetical protein
LVLFGVIPILFGELYRSLRNLVGCALWVVFDWCGERGSGDLVWCGRRSIWCSAVLSGSEGCADLVSGGGCAVERVLCLADLVDLVWAIVF